MPGSLSGQRFSGFKPLRRVDPRRVGHPGLDGWPIVNRRGHVNVPLVVPLILRWTIFYVCSQPLSDSLGFGLARGADVEKAVARQTCGIVAQRLQFFDEDFIEGAYGPVFLVGYRDCTSLPSSEHWASHCRSCSSVARGADRRGYSRPCLPSW